MRVILLVIFTVSIGLRFSGDTLSFLSPFFMASASTLILYISNKFKLGIPLKKQKILFYFLYLFVFIIYIYSTLIWTNSISYGFWKITFLSSWIIMFLIFYETIKENFDLFILWTFVTLILVLIVFYVKFGSITSIYANIYQFYRLGSENLNPISYSRFFGYGIIAYLFLNKNAKMFNRLLLLPIPIIAFLYMIFSGSKGPIISLLIASIYYLARVIKEKTYFLSTTALLVALLIIVANQTDKNSYFNSFIQQRFLIGSLNESSSFTTRFQRLDVGTVELKNSLNKDMSRLVFGSGSGNYSYLYMGRDATSYPHNILVEVLYEYGFVGFMLFVYLIIIVPFHSFFRNNGVNDFRILFLQSTWIYFFTNSMVSGDLSQNFMLFGISIILSILTLENQNDLLRRTNFTT